jgi:hypothetical protein
MLLINKIALFKPKEIQLETDSKTANIEKKNDIVGNSEASICLFTFTNETFEISFHKNVIHRIIKSLNSDISVFLILNKNEINSKDFNAFVSENNQINTFIFFGTESVLNHMPIDLENNTSKFYKDFRFLLTDSLDFIKKEATKEQQTISWNAIKNFYNAVSK